MSNNQLFHKKDNKKSELFRFVNVRAPKIENTSKKITSIDFNEKLYEESNDFYNKLVQLQNLTPQNAKTELNLILKDSKLTSNILKNIDELEKQYNSYLSFYKWLTSVKTETISTIVKKAKSFFTEDITDISRNSKLKLTVWNTYFFHLISGNLKPVQRLTEVLRTISIIESLANDEKKHINSIEKANITLPKTILVLLSIETMLEAQKNTIDESTRQNKSISLSQLESEVQLLINAKSKLQASIVSTEVTEESDDSLDINIKSNIIDKSSWKNLDESTLKMLENIGIKRENTTFENAINDINKSIDEYYHKAFSNSKRSKKVALIGRSVIEEVSVNANTKKIINKNTKSKSAKETILSMYNSWWEKQDPSLLLDILVGDFKRVEQETKKYSAGEVAHIENIIKGERKSRETRRYTRTEETNYYESETTEENERDVQTTDRFEMEKETQNVISTETNLEAGLEVSANYGPVKLNATAGVSHSISTENAKKQALEYAKSVTDKARSSVVKRVKETKTSTIIREFEDKNIHEIDNINSDQNIAAVYRWVDKTYKASLLNYGTRMMVKFNLIEPSAYYQYTQMNNPEAEVKIPLSPDEIAAENPTDLLLKLSSYKDIDENNYAFWAKEYGASVNLPPQETIHVSKGIAEKLVTENRTDAHSIDFGVKSYNDFIIPEGYEMEEVHVRARMRAIYGEGAQAHIFIGKTAFWYDNNTYSDNGKLKSVVIPATPTPNNANNHFLLYNTTDNSNQMIPISIHAKNTHSFACNIIVRCKLTQQAYDNWKKETYEAIIDAYQNKLREAEYEKNQLTAIAGVQIQGKNPLMNKQTIETELKKGCIEAIRVYTNPWQNHYLSQIYANPYPIVSNPNMTSGYDSNIGPVTIRPLAQAIHGKYINFIEECFEWNQITYKFHPYYWANHSKWKTLINLEDNDPLFQNFLKAGSSSIVVPVKPGYEKLFAYYLNTGQLWYGEDVPLREDLNHFIDTELGHIDANEEPIEEACWDIKIPTNLAILQQHDGGINETGLPEFDVKCK